VRTGLVLEGGAMRGMFTAGVCDVLMENGIDFDGCVGVSAGAAFGCNFKSKQIGRVIRYNTKYCKDKRYCSVRSLIKTGDIFGAEFCYHTIPDKLDKFDIETYNNSNIEFYVVSTDVYTGKPVYQLCNKVTDDTYEWFRASASMPMVSKPVKVGGRTMLDGGMSDSIPLEFMVNKGFEKNVVILTQPRDFTKEKASAMGLMKLSLRKYPNMIKCIENRHEMYNKQREYVFEQEKLGSAFIICPEEKLPIGRIEHDAEVLKKVYNIGRVVAEKNLDKLKEFLD
jgi:predicted patatin/cPLA2 family phospholipase